MNRYSPVRGQLTVTVAPSVTGSVADCLPLMEGAVSDTDGAESKIVRCIFR